MVMMALGNHRRLPVKVQLVALFGLLVMIAQVWMAVKVSKDVSKERSELSRKAPIREKRPSATLIGNAVAQDDAAIHVDPYVDARSSIKSLLMHDPLPPYTRDLLLKTIQKVTLIISHCDHDLSWTTDFFNSSTDSTLLLNDTNFQVFIFTKCNNEVIGAPLGSTIIQLPNHGGCDHSYAYWLSHYAYLTNSTTSSITTTNTDTNQDNDMVVFLKDTDMRGDWRGRTFGDLLSLARLQGFACMIVYSYPFSFFHQYSVLTGFHMDWIHGRIRDHHVNVDNTNTTTNESEEGSFHGSLYTNLSEWMEHLQLPIPQVTQDIVPVCYGGIFATTMTQIRQRPIHTWEAMERSMMRGDNIIEGHFSERFWGALLSKPVSNDTASLLWESNPKLIDSMRWKELRGMLTLWDV